MYLKFNFPANSLTSVARKSSRKILLFSSPFYGRALKLDILPVHSPYILELQDLSVDEESKFRCSMCEASFKFRHAYHDHKVKVHGVLPAGRLLLQISILNLLVG